MDKASNPINKCNLSANLLTVKSKEENFLILNMCMKVNLKMTYLREKERLIILITK